MKKLPFLLAALVSLSLPGCGSREEGIRLQLKLSHQAANATKATGTARNFTTDRQEQITLTRASITVNSVELIPCPESTALRWLRELSPVGTAHAHTASSPLRLGTPSVSSLERPDGEPLTLGVLRPPPGRYCRIHLVFGPADADAEGLPVDGSMKDRTFVLEGWARPQGDDALQPFRLESSGVMNVELPLESLALSAEQLESEQWLTLHYDQWLNGTSALASDAATQVLRNVASSTAVVASP
ncbi:hypothetical protein [Hyalangium minutum]|uniref:Putative lipoprotein n=1 Tax=Hyalangium minutum TaxID=394096 RepID=A0A085WMT4_9BACT|nr:hypothetical protein [Hyalangium minutum]KFE68997.1 putative lipoprotein [Hyalangium minutum]